MEFLDNELSYEIRCEDLIYMYSMAIIINYRFSGKVRYQVIDQKMYEIRAESIPNMFPMLIGATIGKYLQTYQGSGTDPMTIAEKKQEISDYVKNKSEKMNKSFGIEVIGLQVDSFDPDENSLSQLGKIQRKQSSWICEFCGGTNIGGKFCCNCGAPRK